jgi:hypothetical protein
MSAYNGSVSSFAVPKTAAGAVIASAPSETSWT